MVPSMNCIIFIVSLTQLSQKNTMERREIVKYAIYFALSGGIFGALTHSVIKSTNDYETKKF